MQMKLSEAIRAGAKLRPASESGWADFGPDGEVRTCALSAATEAAGITVYENGECMVGPNGILRRMPGGIDRRTGTPAELTVRIPHLWARVRAQIVRPPCRCAEYGGPASVVVIVWHLHDLHKWSREAVAEWIETIEDRMQEEREEKLREIARLTAALAREEERKNHAPVSPRTV